MNLVATNYNNRVYDIMNSAWDTSNWWETFKSDILFIIDSKPILIIGCDRHINFQTNWTTTSRNKCKPLKILALSTSFLFLRTVLHIRCVLSLLHSSLNQLAISWVAMYYWNYLCVIEMYGMWAYIHTLFRNQSYDSLISI